MWDLSYLNIKSILWIGGGGTNIFWRDQLLSFKTPTNVLDHIIEIFWTLGGAMAPPPNNVPPPLVVKLLYYRKEKSKESLLH